MRAHRAPLLSDLGLASPLAGREDVQRVRVARDGRLALVHARPVLPVDRATGRRPCSEAAREAADSADHGALAWVAVRDLSRPRDFGRRWAPRCSSSNTRSICDKTNANSSKRLLR